MALQEYMDRSIVFIVIFLVLLAGFFVIRGFMNDKVPEPETEPWDYIIFHTYVQEATAEEPARFCSVRKMYTDSTCTISCADGSVIDGAIEIPQDTAIPAQYMNITSELDGLNCTYSCKGVFAGYTCGGLPE